MLFNTGVMYLVNFVFHLFFGQTAAAFIGWADSPFQVEVSTASVAGFVAAFANSDRRLVAGIFKSRTQGRRERLAEAKWRRKNRMLLRGE